MTRLGRNGVAYNSPTCNPSTVTPIGRDQAANIWYRTLTTYLTSTSTDLDARDGAIKSAKDLYGCHRPARTRRTRAGAALRALLGGPV